MKILGLDLGNKTLGMAISDELGFLARGLETFRFEDRDFDKAIAHTLNVITQHDVSKIVLGYPKNMDGTIGEQGHISEEFKTKLESLSTVTVVLWDERLTSKMASNMMKDQKLNRQKRRNDIDKMAAVVILQGYLDRL